MLPLNLAIRSGDYYMFDALEDEFKLDVPESKDELTEEEKNTSTGRRLSRKLTLGQVIKKKKFYKIYCFPLIYTQHVQSTYS